MEYVTKIPQTPANKHDSNHLLRGMRRGVRFLWMEKMKLKKDFGAIAEKEEYPKSRRYGKKWGHFSEPSRKNGRRKRPKMQEPKQNPSKAAFRLNIFRKTVRMTADWTEFVLTVQIDAKYPRMKMIGTGRENSPAPLTGGDRHGIINGRNYLKLPRRPCGRAGTELSPPQGPCPETDFLFGEDGPPGKEQTSYDGRK